MAAETNNTLNQRREDRAAEQAIDNLQDRNTEVLAHAMDCTQSIIALQATMFHALGDNLQNAARLLTQQTQQFQDRNQDRSRRNI